jgi:hypothetical protein
MRSSCLLKVGGARTVARIVGQAIKQGLIIDGGKAEIKRLCRPSSKIQVGIKVGGKNR